MSVLDEWAIGLIWKKTMDQVSTAVQSSLLWSAITDHPVKYTHEWSRSSCPRNATPLLASVHRWPRSESARLCWPGKSVDSVRHRTLYHLQPARRTCDIILILTLWRPLWPYGYSYKASCARPVKPPFVIFDIRALWRSGLTRENINFVRTADSFTSFRYQLKTYMFARHL